MSADRTLDETAQDPGQHIDESVAHFPPDESELQISQDASQLQDTHHDIDVSVAHFPASDASGAQPGEESFAEPQREDGANASAEDAVTDESRADESADHLAQTEQSVAAVEVEGADGAEPEEQSLVIEEGEARPAPADGAEGQSRDGQPPDGVESGIEDESGLTSSCEIGDVSGNPAGDGEVILGADVGDVSAEPGDGEVILGVEVGEEVVISGDLATRQVAPDPGDAWEEVMPRSEAPGDAGQS